VLMRRKHEDADDTEGQLRLKPVSGARLFYFVENWKSIAVEIAGHCND